jgi:hypothetical protein
MIALLLSLWWWVWWAVGWAWHCFAQVAAVGWIVREWFAAREPERSQR